MAGGTRIVMMMLLSFIRTGVNGDNCGICAGGSYSIAFPCGEDVCIHLWRFSKSRASDYIALISNGEIQTSKLLDDGSKCTLPVGDLTVDVGRHRCRQRPDASVPHAAAAALNLMPGKSSSLQCVLLAAVERRRCKTAQQRDISLTWVDETDAEVQEDLEHRIKRRSPCDITLTLTLQSTKNKRLRCQMTVGEQVQTSVELVVQLNGPRGRRGGYMIDRDQKDGGQDVIGTGAGAGIGVVGCVALTALLVAAVATSRRRANRQPPEEPLNTVSANNVTSADDVVYADIIFPAGQQEAPIPDREHTEYACVQY